MLMFKEFQEEATQKEVDPYDIIMQPIPKEELIALGMEYNPNDPEEQTPIR